MDHILNHTRWLYHMIHMIWTIIYVPYYMNYIKTILYGSYSLSITQIILYGPYYITMLYGPYYTVILGLICAALALLDFWIDALTSDWPILL